MQNQRFHPIHRFIPLSELPPTGYSPSRTTQWAFGDTIEAYRRRGGHPLYGEDDIQYTFNRLGYRSAEFENEADVRILAIGCSYVMGLGLAQHHLFHERFARQVESTFSKSTVVWNMGLCGAGNDYIARLLLLAVRKLNPDVILINFTHISRREFISVENWHVKFVPGYFPPEEINQRIFGHYLALTSPWDDLVHFYKNYKIVEMLLANRLWLYSHIKPQEFESIESKMDLRRFVGPLQIVDRARDGSHPGPVSHEKLANLYWEKFIGLHGADRLKDRSLCSSGRRP